MSQDQWGLKPLGDLEALVFTGHCGSADRINKYRELPP